MMFNSPLVTTPNYQHQERTSMENFGTSVGSMVINQEDLNRRLLNLQEETGYNILQRQGQRIYGGPPPGWTGPAPAQGTEIYCYRLPRDCFEDELVPIFSSVGRIYELRLMIEFSETNRTYCYVRYASHEAAREAVRSLNNYQTRPGCYLAVTLSYDNKKLFLRMVPSLTPPYMIALDKVKEEVTSLVEGVDSVKFISDRGDGLVVEFLTHRLAALARRQLVPGNLMIFGQYLIRQVDWVDPDPHKDARQRVEEPRYRRLDSHVVPPPPLMATHQDVKTSLVRLAMSQGWGLPIYQLSPYSEPNYQVYQATVTMPIYPDKPVAGDWSRTPEEAEKSAAVTALARVFQSQKRSCQFSSPMISATASSLPTLPGYPLPVYPLPVYPTVTTVTGISQIQGKE